MADVTGTRVVIAALGVALVLGVAACSGDDPEPRVAPPSSSPPSLPSTSPASAGISQPAVASEISRSGAESFIDFWFEALSYGMITGDTSYVSGISDADCRSCRALIKQIEDLYAKGGRVKTDGWAVEARTLDGEFDPAAPSFLIRVNEASRVLLDGDKVVDRTPMSKVPMHVQLASASGAWVMKKLEIIE